MERLQIIHEGGTQTGAQFSAIRNLKKYKMADWRPFWIWNFHGDHKLSLPIFFILHMLLDLVLYMQSRVLELHVNLFRFQISRFLTKLRPFWIGNHAFSHVWICNLWRKSLRGFISSPTPILLPMTFQMVTFWVTLNLTFKVKWPDQRSFSHILPYNLVSKSLRDMILSSTPTLLPMAFQMEIVWMTMNLTLKVKWPD